MRIIQKIEWVERWEKNGKKHCRTYAQLVKHDNPLDVELGRGYGDGFQVGDKVEAWFNDRWDYYQFRKPTA